MAEYFQNPQDFTAADDDDDDGDDGGLWKFLPSDIFPLDQEITTSDLDQPSYTYFNYNNYSVDQQRRLSCMGIEDRLSQGFDDFSFSDRSLPPHSSVIPPPNLRRFRPAVQCVCCSGSLPVRCFVCSGCLCGTNHVRGYGNAAVWTPYRFMNPNPVLDQAEWFMEERVGALLDRQRRTMANRVVENPVFPFSAGGGGGYVRDYGGTGVFLPRVPVNISSASSANPNDHARTTLVRISIRNATSREKGKRTVKSSAVLAGGRSRNDEEARFPPSRNCFMNMVHMKKQEDYRSQVSPEMGLPEDWTY